VHGEQVHVIQSEPFERLHEVAAEDRRVLLGNDLRLDDHLFARERGEDHAELALAGAVAARRLDVVDAGLDGAADGRLEVRLLVRGHLGEGDVLPTCAGSACPRN
jgi:hypothetical protein